MKVLFLSLIIAGYSMAHYAPMAIDQFNDYKKSSACIEEKMNSARVDRSQIVVIGDTCDVKEGGLVNG